MCIYKRYIRNVYGKEVMVTCGKCPACLQSKAIRNSFAIKQFQKDGFLLAFVTFTYENDYVPYFIPSEYRDCGDYVSVNVYRDAFPHRKMKVVDPFVFDSLFFEKDLFLRAKWSYLSGKPNCVGVALYSDIQKFVKRLKINLKRKLAYDNDFDYFLCSEYGETTMRPHFHGVFAIPSRMYEDFKRIFSESWPFDDGYRLQKYMQVAYNAASYVSSYVNCVTSIPAILRVTNSTRPRYSFSKNFRMVSELVTLDQIQEGFERGDFTYLRETMRNGTRDYERCLLPVRSIRRCFPKIKGYSRLSPSSLVSVCERPQSLSRFARELGYSAQDLIDNIKLLESAKNRFKDVFDISFYPFMYSRVWSIYYSNLLRLSYESVTNPFNFFYAYDNIKDYFESKVSSDSLDSLMLSLPSNFNFIDDCNDFPLNVQKDVKLRQLYDRYDKKRKVKNYVYSKQNFNM